MVESPLNKKRLILTLLLELLTIDALCAKNHILDWKVFPNPGFNLIDIDSVDLFIDGENEVFVEVAGQKEYLWLNNKWLPTRQYGQFLNGFVKDGRVYLAFAVDKQHIDIYAVRKDVALENRITITDFPKWPGIDQVIYVSGKNDSFYLLGSRQQLPRNPAEFMKNIMSGGHGLYYDKPVLAKIQNQVLLKYQKIPYRGKIDESYRIKEVLTAKDTVHFLGFRTQEQGDGGLRGNQPSPDFLYYAEYNVENKKVVRTQDIYEKTPYLDKNDNLRRLYWNVSADNFNDDLFIIFSWHGIRYSIDKKNQLMIKMEKTNSPIYYSQSNETAFGDVEMIGRGILPLVRVDSLGNIHVIWTNSDGDLVHRAKKGDRWVDEEIVLNGMVATDKVWIEFHVSKKWLSNMSAAFDTDNNLNVVFPSNGNLVYAKVRLNMPDKPD